MMIHHQLLTRFETDERQDSSVYDWHGAKLKLKQTLICRRPAIRQTLERQTDIILVHRVQKMTQVPEGKVTFPYLKTEKRIRTEDRHMSIVQKGGISGNRKCEYQDKRDKPWPEDRQKSKDKRQTFVDGTKWRR